MCGRYSLVRTAELPEVFEISETRIPPRYNIAPTQQVPVVRPEPAGGRSLSFLRWGLIPFWAKDLSIGARMINARAETLSEKPAFRHAFRENRCLVPADGFYEWKKVPGGKQPHYFSMEDEKPFAFAGLWDRWGSGEQVIESFTILTCPPNDLVAGYHDRMPVILPRQAYSTWLSRESTADRLTRLLLPFSGEPMRVVPVSRLVNSPANDGPECLSRES